jgi:hypothetical protein
MFMFILLCGGLMAYHILLAHIVDVAEFMHIFVINL